MDKNTRSAENLIAEDAECFAKAAKLDGEMTRIANPDLSVVRDYKSRTAGYKGRTIPYFTPALVLDWYAFGVAMDKGLIQLPIVKFLCFPDSFCGKQQSRKPGEKVLLTKTQF